MHGADADVILFIFDPTDTHPTDEVIELLRSINKPIILVVKKIDAINKEKADKKVSLLKDKLRFKSIHYVSALQGEGMH